MSTKRKIPRPLFALAFGLAVSVIAYVSVRLLDLAISPEPNPAIVIWTDRSRFIWRVLIAGYLGGASVFGGFGLAARTPERCVVWLERTIIGASIALLVQTMSCP